MRWFIATGTAALALAFTVAVHGQEVKTKTKVEGDKVKTVKYTGCLQSGVETNSFILDKVVPIGQTTRTQVGTAGEVTKTTTTTYALIPGERVEFQNMIGHKVEVTGVEISGNATVKTKVEREDAKDTKEKTKYENALPQLRVTSVKHLSDTCSM